MDNLSTGHLIFAGSFVVGFIIVMVIAYRKDLAISKIHYKRIWLIGLMAVVIYFTIFFLNRIS